MARMMSMNFMMIRLVCGPRGPVSGCRSAPVSYGVERRPGNSTRAVNLLENLLWGRSAHSRVGLLASRHDERFRTTRRPRLTGVAGDRSQDLWGAARSGGARVVAASGGDDRQVHAL
ncbi:hypothetical protein ACFPRL_03490 [Pseudoclavibacter helvolus]